MRNNHPRCLGELCPRPLFTIVTIYFERQVSNRDPILGAPFLGGSTLFTAMFGMAYVIIGSENNYYPAVSIVYFLV